MPLDFGGIVRVAGVDDEAGSRFVGRGFDRGGSDPAGGGDCTENPKPFSL